jgi:hypothetical protein
VNPNLYAGLRWRNVGPFHGGRISSVSGVIGDAGTFYMGTPLGGIWKTTSAGVTWFPVFDQETSVDSIGAIQVAPSNANIVYAGAGDPIGGSLGNGMWKSTDAGKTWQHIGLEDTVKIDSIVVDPTDFNLVVASALGDTNHHGGGVYRSTDGGQTWTNVLKPADYDGTRDLQNAYDDPSVMLAATQGTGGFGGGAASGNQPKAKPRRSSNPPTKGRRGPRSRFRPSRAALRWPLPCTAMGSGCTSSATTSNTARGFTVPTTAAPPGGTWRGKIFASATARALTAAAFLWTRRTRTSFTR